MRTRSLWTSSYDRLTRRSFVILWCNFFSGVNGAITSLVAPPDGIWDVRCLDPLVGEFLLRDGDELHREFREGWIAETETVLWWHPTQGQNAQAEGLG
jgi:hypothetical protein